MIDNDPLQHQLSRRDFLMALALSKPHKRLDQSVYNENSSLENFNPSWPETDQTPEDLRPKIEQILLHPPKIGGYENARRNLEYGFGWATYEYSEDSFAFAQTLKVRGSDLRYYLRTRKISPEKYTAKQKRILDLVPEGATHQEIIKHAKQQTTKSQIGQTPMEALESGKYIGFIATRGNNIGERYLVWTLSDSSPNADLKFVGVTICTDNSGHITNMYKPYSQDGWNNRGHNQQPLEWITDVSALVIPHLPLGKAPSPEYTMAGRPGILLISENHYQGLVTEPNPKFH